MSREQRCTAYAFYHDWHPIGIHDARFVGREWIGAETTTLGLLVDEFFDRGGKFIIDLVHVYHTLDKHVGDNEGLWHGLFAPITRGTSEYVCIPVLESYLRRDAPFPERRNIHVMYVIFSLVIYI